MKLIKKLFFILYFLPFMALADSIPFQDKSPIRMRSFDSLEIEKFKADENFIYELDKEPDLGWFEKLTQWILEFFKDNDIKVEPVNIGSILKIIMWVGILSIAAILIVFLLKSNGIFLFRKSSKEQAEVSFLSFDGSKEDLQALWNKAEANQDHVLALKYLYISSLYLLHRAGLLKWQSDKTNREYLNDLNGKRQFPFAQKLTSIFERVHYGDYDYSASQYIQTKEIFNALRDSMKEGRA